MVWRVDRESFFSLHQDLIGRVGTVMQSTCIMLRGGEKGVEQGQVQCKKVYSFACVMH